MPKTPAHCGTTSGYARHKKRGEATCEPCRDAEAAYRASRPDRQGRHFDVPDLPLLPEALCRTADPDLWHPSKPETSVAFTEQAKAICAACPERDACLAYAMQYPATQLTGVWGGLTQKERKALRRGAAA